MTSNERFGFLQTPRRRRAGRLLLPKMAEVVNSLHDDVAPQDAPVGPARMTEVVNSLHDATT